jgi:long-chain acyl-CoA synthetase
MSLHDAVGAKLFGAGSPLELSEEDIGWRDGVGAPHQAGVRHKVFPRLAQTLVDWFQLPAARGFLDRDFLVLDGQRLTFGETLAQARAVGAWLVQSCGVRRGDRVGICMRNCPEYCIAFIAATSVGACCVPLNSLWTQKELEYGLENSGTSVLFCDTERLKMAMASLGALPGLRRLVAVQHPTRDLVGEGGGLVQHWDEVVSSHAGQAMPAFPSHKDDNAVLMYTSGTTGFPKGVVLTHRGITHALNAAVAHGALEKAVAALRAGKNPASALAPSEEDKAQQVTLLAVPLFHATGLHAVFLLSFIIGRKIVFMHKWAPERALQLIEKEKVTSFTGVPTMVLNMLEHPNRAKYDTRSLQSMGGGGAPPPPSMVREVGSKFKASPTQGFGMTETNAIVCRECRAALFLVLPYST